MAKFISVKYWDLIPYMFIAELKSDLNRYYLGTLWWFLEPCLYVGVFYLAFSHIRASGRPEEYIFFLLCGLATWKWISSGVVHGANSLVTKKALLSNFNAHPAAFPLSTLMGNTFKYVILLISLLVLLAFKGMLDFADPLSLLLWAATTISVIYAYSLLLAPLVVFVPDFRLLIQNVMMLLMWLSGVIFPVDKMSPDAQQILLLNPFVHLIQGTRGIFLLGQSINYEVFLGLLVVHLVLIWIGFSILTHLKGEMPKRLI